MSTLLSFDNPVFVSFTLHSSLVIVKMLGVGVMTAYYRVTKKVFANPEDLNLGSVKTITDDPDVERVRRIHRHDLENIIPYILVGGFYVLTSPHPATALMHFRVFTAARFLHTIVYQFAVPQPARVLAHIVCLGVTGSMLCRVISAAWGSL